jgi:hypothetical protein
MNSMCNIGSHIVLRRADPPHRLYPQDWPSEIDVPRLIVQCLIVPLLAGAALWTMRDQS